MSHYDIDIFCDKCGEYMFSTFEPEDENICEKCQTQKENKMNVKCDCGSSYFIEINGIDIHKSENVFGTGVKVTAKSAGIMCVNCKKVYTNAELAAEWSANINSKEFVLSKWHE